MFRIKARWVLPIDGEPIENGALEIENGIIAKIYKDDRSTAEDFGCAVILPGLVNAHSHLGTTVLQDMVEGVEFVEWIKSLSYLQSKMSDEEWYASSLIGAAQMVGGGITAVGDCAYRISVIDAMKAVGMRGTVYAEIFGLDSTLNADSAAQTMVETVSKARQHAGININVEVSPHSAYTVNPRLLQTLAKQKSKEGWRFAIHTAETNYEDSFLMDGSGPFGDLYQKMNIAWKPPSLSPLRYLHDCGLIDEKTALIHCVNVSKEDIALIRQDGADVVHCPRSNYFLRCGAAPIGEMLEQGVNVALGTDGAVSNTNLDLFEEMRTAYLLSRQRGKPITARNLLRMATINGAKTLGLANKTGSLREGKQADICIAELNPSFNISSDNIESVVLRYLSAKSIIATYISGNRVYERGVGYTMTLSDELKMNKSVIETLLNKLRK